MGAWTAWFWTVVLTVSGVLALNHLGLNVGPAVASVAQGVLHILGTPLVLVH
jgi:hypothetical protein